MYAVKFFGNSADSGSGKDIYNPDGDSITIFDTCPNPYALNTPFRGPALDAFGAITGVNINSFSECDYTSVNTMNSLFNKISNTVGPVDSDITMRTGDSIMAMGSMVKLEAGTYKCSDGLCATYLTMLHTTNLWGEIVCEEYHATNSLHPSCVLDGEEDNTHMSVRGTYHTDLDLLAGTLSLRSLTFMNGRANNEGVSLDIRNNAVVKIVLCSFVNCVTAGGTSQGGAIYAGTAGTDIEIFGTNFTRNSAASGNWDDIAVSDGVSVEVVTTCPYPFNTVTPARGKVRQSEERRTEGWS